METPDHSPPSQVRPATMWVEVAAATRIARRHTNADAHLIDQAAGLYAVADGMGDNPRAGLVAKMALEAVAELFKAPWSSRPPVERSTNEASERLFLGVAQAHGRLYAPGRTRGERIGTTFAGVVVCPEGLCVGHVGDSRVYLLRRNQGRVVLLTEDHTALAEALRRGVPYETAVRSPEARKLTQMIGTVRTLDPQSSVRCWESGDVALICTNGVSDRVEGAIASLLLDAGDINMVARRVVDRAVEVDGSDNATAVLLRRAP